MLSNVGLTKRYEAIQYVIKLVEKYQPSDKRIKLEHITIEGVPVTVIRSGSPSARPNRAIVYFHMGGWVIGSPEVSNIVQVDLALECGLTVFSPTYTLSHDAAYPKAFDECYNVSKYLLLNAASYNISPDHIAIGGESAGGNLAAAVALKLRDEKVSNQPKLQVLLCPCLQSIDFNLPSYRIDDPVMLTKRSMIDMWLLYATGKMCSYADLCEDNAHITNADLCKYRSLFGITRDDNEGDKISRGTGDSGDDKISRGTGDNGGDKIPPPLTSTDVNDDTVIAAVTSAVWNDRLQSRFTDPYFSPLCAPTLAGLPPAYLVSYDCDVLRDDAHLYARRLEAESTPVTHRHYRGGVVHTMMSSLPDDPRARLQISELCRFVDNAL